MLRDNNTNFSPDFKNILSRLGVDDEQNTDALHLDKFECLDFDSFVWMLSGKRTYVVTICDGGSGVPDRKWLANWCRGVAVEELEPLTPDGIDWIGYPGLEDGYDFVQVYRLPDSYDHLDTLW